MLVNLHRHLRVIVAFALAACLVWLPGCDGGESQSHNTQTQSASSAQSSTESNLTFRSKSKLEQHFDKHGWETGCKTAEEYVAAANAVIANPDSLHKLEAEDGDDVYFLEDTGEFVIVSTDGYIRTYYLADKAYFDRQ